MPASQSPRRGRIGARRPAV